MRKYRRHFLISLSICLGIVFRIDLCSAGSAAPPRILIASYSGIIIPVAAEFLDSAISRAGKDGYEALVILLDTPGGLDLSMRQIVKSEMASKVPVIVYIAPQGARAASAGVFIAMAAHIAAMAPGTNIGAAHPVMIPTGVTTVPEKSDGKSQDGVMEGKMVNDAAAYLKSIAHERGRNENWAFQAVTKSSSIPALEAVHIKVADLMASSVGDLLRDVDGRKIPALGVTLHTKSAQIDYFEMSRRQKMLAQLSDPNVAMILMSLGGAGLLIELYNPGLILPGIVGAISLILAFYSFQTLSASYAGVLLLLFGMVLFLLEIKITSYGLLALGGVAATLLGMLMLFQQQAMSGIAVSWTTIASVLSGMLGVTALCSYLVYKAHRSRPTTGMEGMIGSHATTATALSPKGKVRIHGELWDAISMQGEIPADVDVLVEVVDGLILRVRRAG